MNDNENRFLSFFDCINLLREHHLDVSNGRSQEAFFRWYFIKVEELSPSWNILHYYRNLDLSRLGNSFYPSFPTGNARPGQKGDPFVPVLATGAKCTLLSRLATPTGTKGAASATWLAHPFVPVGSFFFQSSFLFHLYLGFISNILSFQLH